MKPEKLKMKISRKDENLEIYLYSEIAEDGYDWWSNKTIPSETSQRAIRDAIEENSTCTHINLYINSDGGSVKEGYGIYSQLKRFTGSITAYVDGFANSIASVIAMAADKVVMYKNSVMIIHNMMSPCYGNAEEHRKVADELDQMMEGNRALYLEKSGGKITEEELIELLNAETVLTAERCLEYGFCDEVVDHDTPEPEKIETAQQQKRIKKLEQAYEQARKYYEQKSRSLEEPKKNMESTIDAALKAAFLC